MSGGCLEGVWRVSGGCLEGDWRVSGRVSERVSGVTEIRMYVSTMRRE